MTSAKDNNKTLKEIRLIAKEQQKRQRIDVFITESVESLSRNRIQSLIKQGQVAVNGLTINEAAFTVKPSDEVIIKIPPVQESHISPADIPLNIIFEDDELLVINKQAGLIVHPGAGNASYTLVNALLNHCKGRLSGIGGVERPGIVHRLDKDTSGLMVVAKTDRAHNALSLQIQQRQLKRKYLAICWQVPVPLQGVIDMNIARHKINRKKMAVYKNSGKRAITHYKIKKILLDGVASLIECELDTGRTHQIRVHMAEIGHSLIGDPAYGKIRNKILANLPEDKADFIKNFTRQALHSYYISFLHPITNKRVEYQANMPDDMQILLKTLEIREENDKNC